MKHKIGFKKKSNEVIRYLYFSQPIPYFTPDFKSEMHLWLYNTWDTGLTKHVKLFRKFTMKNQ